MNRSLVTGAQVITVTPQNAQTLGLAIPADGVIPAHQKVTFGFGKVDYQKGTTLFTGRYFLFKNFSLSNIGGGLTTTDRATDFTDRMDSASLQAATPIGGSRLNEFRLQFARRHQFRTLSTSAAAGPAITVSGSAQFGGPRIGDGNSDGFDFTQNIWQVIDNYTVVKGRARLQERHDLQFIGDKRSPARTSSTFATNQAYLDAKAGTAPNGYTTLQQTFGDLN